MGITEAFLQFRICIRHGRWVDLTYICFGIFDTSSYNSNWAENMGTELYGLAWEGFRSEILSESFLLSPCQIDPQGTQAALQAPGPAVC